MIRRPPISTPLYSSAASDVYKRQQQRQQGFVLRQEVLFSLVLAPVTRREVRPSRRPSSNMLIRSTPSSDVKTFPTTLSMASTTISICSGRNVFAASRQFVALGHVRRHAKTREGVPFEVRLVRRQRHVLHLRPIQSVQCRFSTVLIHTFRTLRLRYAPNNCLSSTLPW